jgi:hypothetical protein
MKTPSKKAPKDVFMFPIYWPNFKAASWAVLQKTCGVGGTGFRLVSTYTWSETGQKNSWHTCNYARYVCKVCHLWLLSWPRKQISKTHSSSPHPQFRGTWKLAGSWIFDVFSIISILWKKVLSDDRMKISTLVQQVMP